MTFIDPRLTERRNARTAAIDLATPLEIVDLLNAEDRTVPEIVGAWSAGAATALDKAGSDAVAWPSLTEMTMLV